MEFADNIIPLIYISVGIISFISGFLLVYRNLKKINLIEGEKFNVEDWISCIVFGLMFSLALMFALDLVIEVVSPVPVPNIGGPILLLLLIILIIYPLWEIVFLGRPTSDAVHDFHKFLETRILDRFHGTMAYIVSALIFIVLYILPITAISLLSSINIFEIAFVWFLLIPLFFLSYYAAMGTIGNIVGTQYTGKIPDNYFYEKPTNVKVFIGKIISTIKYIIALVPLFMAMYNIYSPISTLIEGGGIEQKTLITAYLSLFTTVVFGVKGFFKKFWNKKSKTKIIDFIFAGYIFIGIGVNMLINFIAIDFNVVDSILGFSIFGLQPLLMLKPIMSNYAVLVPLITIQSVINVIFGIRLLTMKNSEFNADIRLGQVNNAFGLDIEQLVSETKKGKKKSKNTKYNLPVLFKSALLPPVYDDEGLDINQPVRQKASQFLYLIAIDDQNAAKQIVEVISKNTINRTALKKRFRKSPFISKEAVDLLGFIGKVYPSIVLNRLITALKNSDTLVVQYILDALGDIGESKDNLKMVLDEVKKLLRDPRYEMRAAAVQSITEMVVEGSYTDQEFVTKVLTEIFDVLDQEEEQPEIVETTLQALLNLCVKIPRDIEIDRITKFIEYKVPGNKNTVGFITQYAISIIGSIVYYNLDKFPIETINKMVEDNRNYIRFTAADALGNYILKAKDHEKNESILMKLLQHSLNDEDPDVRDMCIESVTEFLIMNRNFLITQEDRSLNVLDYYLEMLESENRMISENASEALKSITPLYQGDIWKVMESGINGNNEEVARDLMHTLGLLDEEIHKKVDLSVLYSKLQNKNPKTRGEAVFALGGISQHRDDINENELLGMLEDADPLVRLETIFALGKIGKSKPDKVIPTLIEKFFNIDRQSNARISEVELYAESLGIIGEYYPSNEIIISLQQSLMGDTNPFAKDVIARSLWMIGNGMIKSGNAKRRIESDDFYNTITWLKVAQKKEYTIGNLIIIMIEALQQKGIPDTVMDILSDAMQDLLPAFTFVKNERKKNEILKTMKEMLAQAYYSNYNQEILETIDRIDSLISFRNYFEVSDETLQDQSIFYAKQYTPDGKQFYDQGDTFMNMINQDPANLEYAQKSYEIAIELAPHEFFTPDCFLALGKIFQMQKQYEKALQSYKEAQDIFATIDEIESMKECEEKISEIKVLIKK